MADRKHAQSVLMIESDHRIQLKDMQTRTQKDVTEEEVFQF